METIIQIDESATGFESLRWVAKAVKRNADAHNEALEYIKVEPSRIIATDGHRLHLDNIKTDLKPGLYRVVKSLVKSLQLQEDDTELRYPDIDSVMPDLAECERITLQEVQPWDKSTTPWINHALVTRAMTGNAINPQLMADVLPMDTAYISPSKDRAVTFTNGTRTALLMPIRITD